MGGAEGVEGVCIFRKTSRGFMRDYSRLGRRYETVTVEMTVGVDIEAIDTLRVHLGSVLILCNAAICTST